MSLVRATRPLYRPLCRAASTSMPVRAGSFEQIISAARSKVPPPPPPPSMAPAASGPSSALSGSTEAPVPSTSTASPAASVEPSPEEALFERLSRLIMNSGKLARARKHMRLCLATIERQTQGDPMVALQEAIAIVSPLIRLGSRKRGVKQVPLPQGMTEKQRVRQAWIWIVEASDKKQGQEKIFGKRLGLEVLQVLSGESEAIKKRDARHQQGVTARANVSR